MLINQSNNNMNTFKQSAIEILKKAKTPLHYTEITRLALESGLLETEGATPEASMNAQKDNGVRDNGVRSVLLVQDMI